jgi:hypothetical protein
MPVTKTRAAAGKIKWIHILCFLVSSDSRGIAEKDVTDLKHIFERGKDQNKHLGSA